MTTKVVPGALVATPDAEHASREAATRMAKNIREAIADRGSACIALSGGQTPRPAYALLAKERIDWSRVSVFWVDERAVPPTHDRSNYRMAKEALLAPAKVPEDRIFRMPADAPDKDAAAVEYEKTLRTKVRLKSEGFPNLDLIVLGIGDDGHTASLFPGEPFVSITDRLVVAVPAKDGREARLTITVPVIEHARAILVLALGKTKHLPLERVWQVHGSTSETPARVIRGCRGSIAWVIDRAAGGM